MSTFWVAAMLASCTGNQARVYGTCSSDEACGAGEVCTRSGECLAPSDVSPPVTFQWTINDQVPDATTCAPHPKLHLVLGSENGDDPDLTLEVPCTAGAGLVLDRIHLLWWAGLGPADVPAPQPEPNDVGWDGFVLPGGPDVVMFHLLFRAGTPAKSSASGS